MIGMPNIPPGRLSLSYGSGSVTQVETRHVTGGSPLLKDLDVAETAAAVDVREHSLAVVAVTLVVVLARGALREETAAELGEEASPGLRLGVIEHCSPLVFRGPAWLYGHHSISLATA